MRLHEEILVPEREIETIPVKPRVRPKREINPDPQQVPIPRPKNAFH
jgi:hypothetical protein